MDRETTKKMRIKTVDRCQSICNEVILNPKWKHRLAYVIEALEQERRKYKLRSISLKQAWEKRKE